MVDFASDRTKISIQIAEFVLDEVFRFRNHEIMFSEIQNTVALFQIYIGPNYSVFINKREIYFYRKLYCFDHIYAQC